MNAVPPKISPDTSKPSAQWVALVTGGVLALGACVLLFFFNPSQYHIYPVCTFHKLTGLYCPGCGGTRAAYALLHGDVMTAAHDNALFMLLVVAAGARGLWMGVEKMRCRAVSAFFPVWSLWVVLALAMVFWVVRNLPGFEWLTPL